MTTVSRTASFQEFISTVQTHTEHKALKIPDLSLICTFSNKMQNKLINYSSNICKYQVPAFFLKKKRLSIRCMKEP